MIFFFSLPGTSGTTQPSELPCAIGSLSVHALQEICPSASWSDIQSALAVSNGDADEAAQHLLGSVFILLLFNPFQTNPNLNQTTCVETKIKCSQKLNKKVVAYAKLLSIMCPSTLCKTKILYPWSYHS